MISVRLSSVWASICATILGLLGFSCSSDDDSLLMYGTPTGTFEVKGVVFTEKGSKPVPDAVIKVMDVPTPQPDMSENDLTEAEFAYFKTVTDKEGYYSVTETLEPLSVVRVVCVPRNTALQSDTVLVSLDYVKDKNENNSWYIGKATAEVNFKLKEKSAE